MEVVSYNNYAGFFKRLIAFIIDYLLIRMILWGLLGYVNDYDMFEAHNLFSRQTVAIELAMMAYFVLCETADWQGTLGKRMLGMKVVTESYTKLTTTDAIIRYLSKYLSSLILALGYIWIIFDNKKQGWHDKIAKTFVIDA